MTTTAKRRLRIRHAGGSATIEVPPGSTAGQVAELIAQHCSSAGVPKAEEQAWKCGFPPRPAQRMRASDPFPTDVDLVHVSRANGAAEASVDFSAAPVEGGAAAAAETATASAVDASAIDEPPQTDPDGFVVRRVINADNSCLFNSIGYVLRQCSTDAPALRKMVADAVLDDPHTYTEAFLGRPPDEYAAWIQQPTSWGGQIELSIFSRLFHTEIAAFDVIRDRYDIYGTDGNANGTKYKRRILTIYDGIHYDALAYTFDPSLPESMDVTQFSPRDDAVMERARALCAEQHRKKAFTDTSTFTLRCLVCQEGLVGQRGAAEHAEKTGHANFAEFR